MTEVKTTTGTFLIWERHWLKQWHTLDTQDKKVLAALYWSDLTDEQKDEFTDSDYIELAKIQERKKMDLVNDPIKMRQYFLEEASPLLDQMIQASLGNKKIESNDEYATREVWGMLKEIISSASNQAPLIDLKGKTISDQIDSILTHVSTGKITFDQAKDYMSLVSSGFNLRTLPGLVIQLEALSQE